MPMDAPLQVLVIADNVLTRAGIAALLDNQDDLDVIGQLTSDSLYDVADLYDPEVLLVDLGWDVHAMLEALTDLSSDYPVVALLNDEAQATAVFGTLARFSTYGVLLSETDAELITTALTTAYTGLLVIDPALANAITASITTSTETLIESLTPREDEVLQLLAQGMTNKAIAHTLGITDHTVKFHVNAIMNKLNAQSRTEAVVQATRAGLIIL